MGHHELKEIRINAYGHRHKIIKGVERLVSGPQSLNPYLTLNTASGTVLIDLAVDDKEFPAMRPHWRSLQQVQPGQDPKSLQQEAVGEVHAPQEGGVRRKPQPLQRAHDLPRSEYSQYYNIRNTCSGTCSIFCSDCRGRRNGCRDLHSSTPPSIKVSTSVTPTSGDVRSGDLLR
ncbi:arf-GAP with Rho-GAP domain, ANK repeat and PH domain-containing protein 3-like isoform X2 [Anabas testudineus]|uniref:arf-GAP with Rho-GAP domain, ANK repeat and PH domain-containing protein 3-like isoform X2 n=1 Tax=Anabas testudineus TaxID=64144 RepID=UPI00143CD92A|nr:arf-GAP with Rho-GAP domain, ANK repeat and PH domain-containing protein 3-like isoform X2 [Anabas testudineus]